MTGKGYLEDEDTCVDGTCFVICNNNDTVPLT